MLLTINQPIEVYDPERDKTYKTMISDISNERISFAFPVDHAGNIYFHQGALLEISFTREDSKYKFTTEITGSRKDNIFLYEVRRPSENEFLKVQRRQFVRVPVNITVHCNLGNFHVNDISGGGFLFSCRDTVPVEADTSVKGTLILPGINSSRDESVPFEGVVIRVTPQEEEHLKKAAVEFTQLDEKNRQKIIHFCFQIQLRNKRIRTN